MQQADYSGFSRVGDAYLQGRDIREQRIREDKKRAEDKVRQNQLDAERKRADRDRLLVDIGPDAIMDPNGNVDVAASMQERQRRTQADTIAQSAGELEALGIQQDIPQELRTSPAYRAGQARGLVKKQERTDRENLEKAIEALRTERATKVQQLRNQGRPEPVDRTDDISITEEDPITGTTTTRRFASPEDFDAWKSQNSDKAPAKKQTPQAMSVDKAMADFEAAFSKGEKVRLIENEDGTVEVEKSSLRPDNPAIVRRRLEQLNKRNGGAGSAKPNRVMTLEELGIKR